MSTDEYNQWIPVEALCKGLYVAELDCPWTDTPFLFQGFELTEEPDLTILRQYCRRVSVDRQRSRDDALAQMAQRIEQQGGPNAARGAETPPAEPAAAWAQAHPDASETFGQERKPDGAVFRQRLIALRERRDEAARLVERALDDVRLGAMVNTEETRDMIDSMIESVARDARAALWLTSLKEASQYTTQHSAHVCVMTLAFGMYLGIERQALMRMALGALLHDVGKIHVPEQILDKPGPLTLEEFERVKRHPVDGFEAISASGGVPPEALQVIRLHHERLTGTGYPEGLAGDRVPRHVLIVGLADTYDAMTSDRPYRKGMEPDRVLQTIHNEMAAEFGNDLVQAFLRCMGVFPEGSLVQLDNGAVGIVLSTRAEARLQPVVMMVQDPDGRTYNQRRIINLAVSSNNPDDPAAPRRIARAVPPSACNFNVENVLAEEFQLETA